MLMVMSLVAGGRELASQSLLFFVSKRTAPVRGGTRLPNELILLLFVLRKSWIDAGWRLGSRTVRRCTDPD